MKPSRSSEATIPLGASRQADGSVVVPASRRADGSVRKPIRIRKGYVPQEERQKYRPPGAAAAAARARGSTPPLAKKNTSIEKATRYVKEKESNTISQLEESIDKLSIGTSDTKKDSKETVTETIAVPRKTKLQEMLEKASKNPDGRNSKQ